MARSVWSLSCTWGRRASTGCLWTWPPRTSCCSPSTAPSWSSPGPASSSWISASLPSDGRVRHPAEPSPWPASSSVRLRLRGGDDRVPRIGLVADSAPRRLSAGGGRRCPGRRRDRGDPLPAHARGGRVPHRRAPRGRLSRGAGVRPGSNAALLPGDLLGHRDRCPTLRRSSGRRRRGFALAVARPVRLSLQLAGGDRRADGAGAVTVQGGRFRHACSRRSVLPRPRPAARPPPAAKALSAVSPACCRWRPPPPPPASSWPWSP